MKNLTLTFVLLFAIVFWACKKTTAPPPPPAEIQDTSAQIELENSKSIIESGDNITKAYVFSDSLFYLRADMKKDHRFFGYQSPDKSSKKLLLFSIFTNDIEGNPFDCELGAYYDLEEDNGLVISYLGNNQGFVEAMVSGENGNKTKVYFEEKWVIIERMASEDEIQEYGLIEKVEDNGYPFFTVTVGFVERQMKQDFNLNIEAISIDLEKLDAITGQYATIYYLSEMENSLIDLHFEGYTLFGEYAPEFDTNWKKITGILSGATEATPGDLPGIITITDVNNQKMIFELFIDSPTVEVNGKTVTAYYYARGVNNITHIAASDD